MFVFVVSILSVFNLTFPAFVCVFGDPICILKFHNVHLSGYIL